MGMLQAISNDVVGWWIAVMQYACCWARIVNWDSVVGV
jgi:hypothetical protein